MSQNRQIVVAIAVACAVLIGFERHRVVSKIPTAITLSATANTDIERILVENAIGAFFAHTDIE